MFKIAFLTSSRVKLSHARYLCQKYNVSVLSKRQYGIAYSEPRLTDRTELLHQSFEDAYKRWVKAGANPAADWFFLEDTSVIIHALSSECEFPGLDIKYWMREANFANLDAELKRRGNNRTATIRSDVVLYIPPPFQAHLGISGTKKVFTSELNGSIVNVEQNFDTDILYPWLDNRSFNKWFIPKGLSLPISLLSIHDATRYDIRGSIKQMLRFLEKKKVVSKSRKAIKPPKPLGFEWTSSFIICGLPCSGKSTLGRHLAEVFGYYHIEASDFMRVAYYELHGPKPDVPLEIFAERALKASPGIVVERILNEIERIGDIPLIITGFRSPLEIDLLQDGYRGSIIITPYVVTASATKRYNRSILRGRNDKVANFADFVERDRLQTTMGLGIIAKRLRGQTILNNSTLAQYFHKFFTSTTLSKVQVTPAHSSIFRKGNLPLESRIVLALAKARVSDPKPLSTTEIAHLIKSYFPNASITTNKNNVSRYFNFQFHSYYKVIPSEKSLTYELTQTGYGRALSISNGLKRLHPSSTGDQLDLGL